MLFFLSRGSETTHKYYIIDNMLGSPSVPFCLSQRFSEDRLLNGIPNCFEGAVRLAYTIKYITAVWSVGSGLDYLLRKEGQDDQCAICLNIV